MTHTFKPISSHKSLSLRFKRFRRILLAFSPSLTPFFLSRTSWKEKKKKRNPQTWNRNENAASRCHLPQMQWWTERGDLWGSKGTFNEQALYWSVDKTVVNYVQGGHLIEGSETRSLLAKRIHGQEGRAFDWVPCHWGKGWDTAVTQPMPLDLPFLPLLSASHFSLSLSKWHSLAYSALPLFFQIKRKCPPISSLSSALCALLSSVEAGLPRASLIFWLA